MVRDDDPTFRDDKLPNLKFSVGDCIARNPNIGGTVKTTEEDVLTPVQSGHSNLRVTGLLTTYLCRLCRYQTLFHPQ